MKTLFVDTFYWIAVTNPKDNWHQKCLEVREEIKSCQLLTTELVLVEFLNYFSEGGDRLRKIAVNVVKAIMGDANIEVVFQSYDLFNAGLELYEQRLDKGYSMVDCISMVVMRDRSLNEALTHDQHFSQEGFSILL